MKFVNSLRLLGPTEPATFTPSRTPTRTPTPTNTATPTRTFTPTRTPTATPTAPASGYTLFGTSAPSPVAHTAAGASPVNLGLRFRSNSNGYITGIRFYKHTTNTGTHRGYLWTNSGTLLASATFSGETTSGWQTVTFTTPVAITANTVYVATYHSANGGFSYTTNFFNAPVINGPLTALASSEQPNGRYIYGAPGLFPNATYSNTNNWVDPIFQPSTPTATPTPGVCQASGFGFTANGPTIQSGVVRLITQAQYQAFPAADTQELRDLLIMPQQNTSDPIYVLAAPTINAQRTGPSFIWSNFLRVYQRVDFPQTVGSIGDQQIWYQVSDPALTAAQGWIPVRYDGRNYLDQLDPCLGLVPTPTSLTFPYDRPAAANYAIEHSYDRDNFPASSLPQGRVVRQITGIPFADFNYSYLSSSPGSTGSTMFVSQGVWAGGLPMTAGDPTSCNPTPSGSPGWRYCRNLLGASNPWDFHQEFAAYYTDVDLPGVPFVDYPTSMLLASGNLGQQIKFVSPSCGTKKQDRISSGEAQNDVANQDIDSFFVQDNTNAALDGNRGGILSNSAGLVAFLQQVFSCASQSLVQGDYIYINPQLPNGSPEAVEDGHGLLVVGWGPVVDNCSTAFGTRLTINNFSPTRTSSATVPYVAVFTTAQPQRARPFYCTMAFDDG